MMLSHEIGINGLGGKPVQYHHRTSAIGFYKTDDIAALGLSLQFFVVGYVTQAAEYGNEK